MQAFDAYCVRGGAAGGYGFLEYAMAMGSGVCFERRTMVTVLTTRAALAGGGGSCDPDDPSSMRSNACLNTAHRACLAAHYLTGVGPYGHDAMGHYKLQCFRPP